MKSFAKRERFCVNSYCTVLVVSERREKFVLAYVVVIAVYLENGVLTVLVDEFAGRVISVFAETL